MRIYVSGVFDILHNGHISMMEYAKHLGTYLIVGLVRDEDASSYKRKPIESLEERMSKVRSLKVVDQVVIDENILNLSDEFLDRYKINLIVIHLIAFYYLC